MKSITLPASPKLGFTPDPVTQIVIPVYRCGLCSGPGRQGVLCTPRIYAGGSSVAGALCIVSEIVWTKCNIGSEWVSSDRY